MTTTRLDRYVGTYHAGSFVKNRALIPIRVRIQTDGDKLVAVQSGEQHVLVARGEHRFEQARERTLEFVIGPSGRAESLALTRNGETTTGPWLAPLPGATPADPTTFTSTELGHATLCMPTQDVETAARFYAQLGFSRRDDDGPYLFHQGWASIAFMDWLSEPCINFRGPSIHAMGSELARRGFEILGLDDEANRIERHELPVDEGGMFSIVDPDGHHLFFNTHAGEERASYEAWKRGSPGPGPQERKAMSSPVEMDLGQLVVCLDVVDLDTSVDFYRRLGMRLIERGERTATFAAEPARPNPRTLPLLIRQAAIPRFSFGFRCTAATVAALEARSIPIVGSGEHARCVDPDHHHIGLLIGP